MLDKEAAKGNEQNIDLDLHMRHRLACIPLPQNNLGKNLEASPRCSSTSQIQFHRFKSIFTCLKVPMIMGVFW